MSIVNLTALILFFFVLEEKEASELSTLDYHRFDYHHPAWKNEIFQFNARECRERSALL